MRTTLDINDALLLELRERAARTGRPFRAVVDEAIALGLAAARDEGKRRFRVKPHRLGLKRGFDGVSLNQLYDQLDAESTASKL